MEHKQIITDLIDNLIEQEASDLHLSEDKLPIMRVASSLIPLVRYKVLSRQDLKGILDTLLSQKQKEQFVDQKEVDFAYDHRGIIRLRGNAYFQLGKISVALRLIPKKIRTMEELNLPPILESFVNKQQGFFLVVGPTGQGKSTTLAAMINHINTHRLEHIITIEDPIEYIFESDKSLVEQREIREDTPDFHTALRGVFRQDIDVLMIGEMREPETIATAVTAAETGHLVFSTLHTNTASQTVARIVDSFVAEQQSQIRVQLSASLIGIFSQRLIPRISGGMVPAYELLINNAAVANLIRENRVHELNSVIETGSELGMIDLNRTLSELVKAGEITVENAYMFSQNSKGLERLL
ncbi:MAG: PilT/PilU family type 4a pilus ATPase [Candidatus Zambryskibacteria bacterium]|nr:PilT/PilU family type 4a pilus ATPase [Candidatus Zambryskibacteria bacterium]